jgi:two-component system chemotaxis response regulator CheB
MMNPIKVGVVDDSRLVREMVKKALSGHADIVVVGEAEDPYEARDMIKKTNPDVITLDIEMPKMNGIDFLKKIMALHPMPVIMLSTLTARGAVATIDALELGAMDYIHKPDLTQTNHDDFLMRLSNELLPKIRAVPNAKFKMVPKIVTSEHLKNVYESKAEGINKTYAYDLALIGSSTGGMERLRYIVQNLRAPCPSIIIVQHMSPLFTDRMIERLGQIAAPGIQVVKSEQGAELKQSHVYISANEQHLALKSVGSKYMVLLEDGPPMNGFVASVDHLFFSVATALKKSRAQDAARIHAYILSGMGNDGAEGMLRLKNEGVTTIGENEQSCLIYGMSKVAQEKGATQQELSIQFISQMLSGQT